MAWHGGGGVFLSARSSPGRRRRGARFAPFFGFILLLEFYSLILFCFIISPTNAGRSNVIKLSTVFVFNVVLWRIKNNSETAILVRLVDFGLGLALGSYFLLQKKKRGNYIIFYYTDYLTQQILFKEVTFFYFYFS